MGLNRGHFHFASHKDRLQFAEAKLKQHLTVVFCANLGVQEETTDSLIPTMDQARKQARCSRVRR